MKTLRLAPMVLILLLAAFAIPASAQTFTNLVDLSPTTGWSMTPFIQGLDGNLYAAANFGGTEGTGKFIKLSPSGTLSVVYEFCSLSACADGYGARGTLALGPDGNFYGTTFHGGDNSKGDGGSGVVYKLTPQGTLTVLHTFCRYYGCPDGAHPGLGVSLAWNGDLYGVSGPTGAQGETSENVVFRVSPAGIFNRLIVVCPNLVCPINAGPSGLLVQASGGYLIGPGPGGAYNAGAIYRMTPSGTSSVIYSFCPDATCHDGFLTNSPLIQTSDGALYGTNWKGGAGANCHFENGACGTAFRITVPGGGVLKTLHNFCNWTSCNDGGWPEGPTILASDGNFYGTTAAAPGEGGVFRLTPGGKFTVIHEFNGSAGCAPSNALVQHTDGDLYGSTVACGPNNEGTIFRISLGLPPFVQPVQNAGKTGATAIILGNNLTGSTGVTFNGTAATFSVVSDTEITATVPAAATTGKIQVVTPSKTLASNLAFTVLK